MRVGHLKWIPQGNNRLCLARFYFLDDTAKLSISIVWEPRDLWLGLYWDKKDSSRFFYLCLVPCLPIRVHWKRAWGGKFG